MSAPTALSVMQKRKEPLVSYYNAAHLINSNVPLVLVKIGLFVRTSVFAATGGDSTIPGSHSDFPSRVRHFS